MIVSVSNDHQSQSNQYNNLCTCTLCVLGVGQYLRSQTSLKQRGMHVNDAGKKCRLGSRASNQWVIIPDVHLLANFIASNIPR